MARKVNLLSLTLLIIGFACGYALSNAIFSYVLLHIGGLGSLGLLAGGAGYIARKKGYGYWPTFSLALSSSILIGVIGAYLVPPAVGDGRPAACGGSVSLIVALIFIAVWSFKKQRDKVVFSPSDEV